MYIILAGIIIGGAVLTSTFDDTGEEYETDDWREVLQEENEALIKENKAADEEDAFVIDINTDTIEKNNYYLENDIQPTSFGAWQYVLDNKGLLSIVSLLTIIVAAGIVANEFRWGTIKLLLIRPISRTKILASKYIAVLLFAFFTLLFVLIFSWIIGALFFGVEGLNPHIVIQEKGNYAYVSVIEEMLSGYYYKLINLLINRN